MADIKTLKSYKQFRHDFENEAVYTRAQMSEMLEKCKKEHLVNRIILRGKDYDVAMNILEIFSTPEGLVVVVK